jgi:5'(3')-deoxyribonucleotidase
MPEVIVEVFTPGGIRIGKFIDPKVELVSHHNYSITGRFVDADGQVPDKIEYNPEILPYSADLSTTTYCAHKEIVKVYVHRGRQPVQMIGVCKQ